MNRKFLESGELSRFATWLKANNNKVRLCGFGSSFDQKSSSSNDIDVAVIGSSDELTNLRRQIQNAFPKVTVEQVSEYSPTCSGGLHVVLVPKQPKNPLEMAFWGAANEGIELS